MHISNQYQGCNKPVTEKIPGFPLQKPPLCYIINYSDTKKLLPRAGANPGFGDLRVGIYGELGAPAYSGDLGASPPVVSSGKAPGGVGGLCPLKLTNYQQMLHSLPNKTHIKYGKILEQ